MTSPYADRIPLVEIVSGDRTRADLGDLSELMGSMKRLGLLHPVVLNTRNELVAGGRRLEAARRLFWETIPVRVVATLDEAAAALHAELDENVCRKPLTPTELVRHAERLAELERPKAEERQAATRAKPGEQVGGGKFPPPTPDTGKTRDKVAAALGTSGRTLEKAAAVVKAAESEPERFGDLPAKMDAAGKVDGAHREMRQRQAAPPPQPASKPADEPRPAAPDVKAIGLTVALEVENLLKRVPVNDPQRQRAWSRIRSFLDANAPVGPTAPAQDAAVLSPEQRDVRRRVKAYLRRVRDRVERRGGMRLDKASLVALLEDVVTALSPGGTATANRQTTEGVPADKHAAGGRESGSVQS